MDCITYKGYKVFSDGTIIGKSGNPIGTIHKELGYVCISVPGFRTGHKLVATLFIPNPDNKPEVDHINGIRYDNRVENLRWVDKKENSKNSHCLEELPEEAQKYVIGGRENSRRYNKRKRQKRADKNYEDYPRILEFEDKRS